MRSLAVVASSVLLVAPLMGMGTAGAARSGDLPRICAEEESGAAQWGADLSRLGSEGIAIMDGRELVVRGEDASWRMWDDADPAFATRFHSMSWLVPGVRQGLPVVDILLERDAAAPDPSSRANAQSRRASGWTPGIIRLRMGTVACLYAATSDPRLEGVMDRLVAANLDPYRYRGAPLNKVHNQGTLANVALLEAARVFDRPEWREPAIRRFEADAGTVFDQCGMSAEQSTNYHRLNVNLWRRSLAQIGAEVDAALDLGTTVSRAALATWQLTRPDGVLDAIGNGNQKRIDPADLDIVAGSALDTRLYCPDQGWAANRTSWDDTATHYVLRFGPRPAAHGHEDRGALTWTAMGVPVFSDRGVFDRSRGERWRWSQSPSAHSTFHGIGTTWRRPFKASYERAGGKDAYRVWTSYRGDTLERVYAIEMDPMATEAALHVSDTGRSTRARQWYQRWQLDQGWMPLARRTPWEPAAVHPGTGMFLYGSCWSGMYMRMSVTPVETFPAWRSAVPTHSMECGGLDRLVRMQALWVVSPVEGLLSWDVRTGEYAVAAPTPEPEPEPTPEPTPEPVPAGRLPNFG